MKVTPRNFEVGFWHPFGDHADEKAEDILFDDGWSVYSGYDASCIVPN